MGKASYDTSLPSSFSNLSSFGGVAESVPLVEAGDAGAF